MQIENLMLLTKNRPRDSIIFVSTSPLSITAANWQKFLTIPIVPFEDFFHVDYQLNLLEIYILSVRNLECIKQKIITDFKVLSEKADQSNSNDSL
jgi:hypothetical protein